MGPATQKDKAEGGRSIRNEMFDEGEENEENCDEVCECAKTQPAGPLLDE